MSTVPPASTLQAPETDERVSTDSVAGDAGTDVHDWLAEGEAVIRAVAERVGGLEATRRSPARQAEAASFRNLEP